MNSSESLESVELTRDIEAIQIPSGESVVLPKGAQVTVTQSLGGSLTVHCTQMPGLYRVSAKHADALGMSLEAVAEPKDAGELTEEIVWNSLKTCYDPEIPVNIVDLGLIYSMQVEDVEGGKKISVKMTLTAPGCGMGPAIASDARHKLLDLPKVKEATVEIVWEPAWNPSMITSDGKAKLGIT